MSRQQIPYRKERTTLLRDPSERATAPHSLNLTSLTVTQFAPLGEPFEPAFVRSMQGWITEGKPRPARAATPAAHSPLPPPAERRWCRLPDRKVAALRVAHAAVFSMPQPTANTWLHIRLIGLPLRLRDLGAAPARQRLAVRDRRAQLQPEPPAQAARALLCIPLGVNDRSPARTTMLRLQWSLMVQRRWRMSHQTYSPPGS
jgi:hypothetical protein